MPPYLSRSLAIAIVVVATMVSTAAIIATYSKLSNTWDEPTHVVAGLEFLQDGRYGYQIENPSLPRVALAIIPYLLVRGLTNRIVAPLCGEGSNHE